MISLNKNFNAYISSTAAEHAVTAAFGTKQLGDGREPEKIINKIYSLSSFQKFILAQQTHSVNIHVVTQFTTPDDITNCDGLITREKGVGLGVITADCVPIIFIDFIKNIIGISHQGWTGTLHHLPKLMIQEFQRLGSNPKDIFCIIGPSINDCCYEIYGKRKKHFKQNFGKQIFKKENNKVYLNLIKANYQTLVQSGIGQKNIEFFPFCTSCDKLHFWSYRRDRELKGEMLSFVVQ